MNAASLIVLPLPVEVCDAGHYAAYPDNLLDTAYATGVELGCCVGCECGQYVLVVAWPDHVRLMEYGDHGLPEEFAATGWPLVEAGNPIIGPFQCRAMLKPALFLHRANH
ncbi:hypothetical protein [Nocardia noduli]|uniref:hypothetical protein n=1 Tax=Nocardia noduli TaxID=2815722 RepID=UPI001C2434C6|nr:hypothetical protein [Nocardia noduli]